MLKAEINKQDTKHGKMDMPFKNLNRFAGMNKGGNVKKTRWFAEGGRTLADDETMLVPYTKLSEKKKAEMVAARARDFKEAEAEQKRPAVSRALDTAYKYHPLLPSKLRKDMGDSAAEDAARREDRYLKAKEEQDNPVLPKGALYGDDVPHKIDRKARLFKKGGNVKDTKWVPPWANKGKAKAEGEDKAKGKAMKFAKGGGIESRGKTKGTIVKMASGGAVKGFARGGGIESRGKTRGKMC